MIEATAINGVGASFNCDQVIVEIVSFVGPAKNNDTIVSLIEIANPQIPDIAIAGYNNGKMMNHKVSRFPAPSPIATFSNSGLIFCILFFRIKSNQRKYIKINLFTSIQSQIISVCFTIE